jgi:hypothetical protein
MATKKLKKNVDVFAAVERIRNEILTLINVTSVELSFKVDTADKYISCTIFYISNDNEKTNFTVHLYSFNSNFSYEELIQEIKNKAYKLKILPETGFTAHLA